MTTQSPLLKKYRELLGVGETASGTDLKKAYHQMALLYHPDRNPDPDAPAQFQRVREAYEVLTDPARVLLVQRDQLKERLFDQCVAGLTFSFGAFFGCRIYASPGETFPVDQIATAHLEGDRSILDHPAYDSLEVVYAGKFSLDDELRLSAGGRKTIEAALPWVVLNNAGILDFLDGRYAKALRRYEELNRRIPGNIIFLYREALCRIIIAYESPKPVWFGRSQPDRAAIRKGLSLLRLCVHLGETRPVGRQTCLVIRKFMADVLEHSGQRRAATRIWQDISKLQPRSIEAKMKTGKRDEARALLKSRARKAVPIQAINRSLLEFRKL